MVPGRSCWTRMQKETGEAVDASSPTIVGKQGTVRLYLLNPLLDHTCQQTCGQSPAIPVPQEPGIPENSTQADKYIGNQSINGDLFYL